MSEEFMMPAEPEELWLPDSELSMKVQNLYDFSEGCTEDISDVAESISFKLCDDNPLCIIEQDNFDQLCSVIRCFDLLQGPKRRQLLDALCSSLTCLNACIDRLMATPVDSEDREALVDYRSAFKAYLFFLQWVAKIADREAATASANVNAAAAPAGTKARGRKKVLDDVSWDWSLQFAKVMKAVGRSMNTDLWALFRPNRPDQTTLLKLIQLSTSALENPSAAKDEDLASGAAQVLSVTALKYQQLDSVTGALVDALNKFEHTPAIIAELLRYSVAQFDDGRLVAAVIAEVAAVDPAEYERQQNATGEKAGVRSVAAFVEGITQSLPRLMATQIALLLPHLGGKAYSMRSGIVTAIGYLLHKAFEPSGSVDVNDAQYAARLRSKQHLLDILCERVRDQSSYTRKAVLQTWQYLAENRAVPLGHWQVVTGIAVGRLEDKSSLVRKEALRLLGCLMLHNPFGPALPVDRFDASLTVHKAMLDAVMPAEDDMSQSVNITDPKADRDEDHNREDQGAEMGEEDAAAMEVDEDSVAHQNEQDVDKQQHSNSVQRKPRSPIEVGWDGTVEELQALVASLELAVDFARALSGCMPTLVQLLASSSVTDVQESIAMLLTCKQFEVAGAPEAIRKMLPLVFARDQAVKDRIVEALDQLYITGWAGHSFSSAQAARNLVDLASGATLGELGSLEEVVKELMAKGFMTPVTLHELWEIAGRAGAAVVSGAQGANRARKDLRAALSILSMAAACKPEAFGEHQIASFLKLGFTGGAAADALTSRHACVALQRLSENLKDKSYDRIRSQMYAALTRTVVASPLPESSWYSAAEAAITALYNLHPAPEHICSAIMRHVAATAFNMPNKSTTDTENSKEDHGASPTLLSEYSATALSRFFFVVGHVALQHLVLIERTAKAVRRARFEAEKRAAEEKVERLNAKRANKNNPGDEDEDEDINAELGVGSVAADAELDAMKEAAETQILSAQNLLGPYAALVSAVCRQRAILSVDPTLRASALLALSKLMIVDSRVCDDNLQLMFTLLSARSVEPALRSNLTIALGDLALRFPNQLEPWTEHMYRPLGDPDSSVRKNALMVLSHLILNDMMKVKGHIAKMAVCLEDDDERISALAELFFHELSKKEYKGTSPIYNLLPDILSNLSKESGLSRAGFQSVMQRLLGYIKKDKQGDALVEKLCQRFDATEDPGQWRNVAFCLSQLPISEKGVRKLAECFKFYKTALADGETTEVICAILSKAKKSASKPDVKTLIEELEAKIEAAAVERAEEEEAAAKAAKRAAKDRGDLVGRPQEEGDEDVRHRSEDADMEEAQGFEEASDMVQIKKEVDKDDEEEQQEEEDNDDDAEQASGQPQTESEPIPLRGTRSRQASLPASSDEQQHAKNQQKKGQAPTGGSTRAGKTQGARRTRATVADSDGDEEDRIAAIGAKLANVKVEDE